MARLRRYYDVVLEPTTGTSPGKPVDGAAVTVKIAGTQTLAALFSDRLGQNALANPVMTDAFGRYAFFVADGDYDLGIVKAGVVNITLTRVSIVDPKLVIDMVRNLKQYAVGDGITSDAQALRDAVADTPDGGTLVIPKGQFLIDSQVVINKRVSLVGFGLQSALIVSVGVATDAIVFDKGAGASLDNIRVENFAIMGAANSCKNAVVFRRVHRSRIQIDVKAGTAATGYGARFEGCLINHIEVTISSNVTYPYAGTKPENGILLTVDGAIASNANFVDSVVEGMVGDGLVVDMTALPQQGNNWIRGTYEGITGRGIRLVQCAHFHIFDIHVESNAPNAQNAVRLETCTRGFVGPAALIVAPLELVGCANVKLDGVAAQKVTIDSACTDTEVGDVSVAIFDVTGTLVDSGLRSIYTGMQSTGVSNVATPGPGLVEPINLHRNGGFEAWPPGGVPVGWTIVAGTAVRAGTGEPDTRKLFGEFSAKVSGASGQINGALEEPELSKVKGKWITVTAWVFIPSGQANSPVVALRVWINGGATTFSSLVAQVSATDVWTRVTLSVVVPSTAVAVDAVLVNTIALAGDYLVDGVSILLGKAGAHAEAVRTPKRLAAEATLNFGAPGAVPGAVDLAIAVQGAAFGDKVIIGAPVTVGVGYVLTGFVSAANQVTIRWMQIVGAPQDPDGAGGTYTVVCERY